MRCIDARAFSKAELGKAFDDWDIDGSGTLNYCGLLAGAPGAEALKGAAKPAAGGATSGSLFKLVKKWLLEEREAKSIAATEVPACPPTPMVVDVSEPAPAPKPAPAPSAFGGRFDRFGGASRQGMYA